MDFKRKIFILLSLVALIAPFNQNQKESLKENQKKIKEENQRRKLLKDWNGYIDKKSERDDKLNQILR